MEAKTLSCLLRKLSSISFWLAAVFPFCLGIVAWCLIRFPWDGLDWVVLNGSVLSVYPDGPSAGLLYPGDTILTVEGVPARQSLPLYAGLKAGDPVGFTVGKDGHESHIVVYLAKPTWPVLLGRLMPLVIASGLWGVGSTVLALQGACKRGRLFFLFCLASAGALASGALSNYGPLWISALFNLLLWWGSPLAVHFHLYFPEHRPFPGQKWLLRMMYGVTVGASLPYLAYDLATLRASRWYPLLHTASRSYMAMGLLIVCALLGRAYIQATRSQRQQIQFVLIGGGLGVVPLAGLVLLPDALIGHSVIPYEVAFAFFMGVPLGYGYAILRHRLIQIDRYINRSIVYAFTIMVGISIYLLLNAAVRFLLPPDLRAETLIDVLVILLTAASFDVIRRQLQKLIDRVFYGGWYDYRSVVEKVVQDLGKVTSLAELMRTTCDRLCGIMKLKCACLPLTSSNYGNEKDAWHTGFNACCGFDHGQAPFPTFPENGTLCRYLADHKDPVDVSRLRQLLEHTALSEAEQRLLDCEQARVWIPIVEQQTFLGALIVGSKPGDEPFDTTDLSILRVIAHQIGRVVMNLQLDRELRLRVEEVNRLHGQIILLREEERKRIARELHDQVIQALISLQYELARHNNVASSLQTDVRQLVGQLRLMCRDLRPPMLDNLGLIPAVRSYVREIRKKEHIQIDLYIDGEDQHLPEKVGLTLFRALQEAMANVKKHAAAKQVLISLSIYQDEAILSVCDDGKGFVVPSSLMQLIENDRFGLVGLRERLDLIHGELDIASVPGQGTELYIRVPLLAQSPMISEKDGEEP